MDSVLEILSVSMLLGIWRTIEQNHCNEDLDIDISKILILESM